MRLRRYALPAIIALIVATGSATAQTPIVDDPLSARDAKRLDRMEQVLRELRSVVFQGRDIGKPVVVQPAETEFQLQELTRRVNDLEQTLRRVNGQLETTTRDLELARRANEASQAQLKTLAERLAVIEPQAAPPPPPPSADATPPAPPPPALGATDLFAEARRLMNTGDYDGAERAWQDFVAQFGDHPRAPEARYWLGKTLGVRGAHNEAAAAYIGAVRGWPQTTWGADAVVELSRELIALRRAPDACQMLGELDRRYPKATPAAKSRAAATRAQAKCA